MKRGGGADIFLRSIEKMRRTIPGLTLRTSFIVGFPGETEKEFEELCDFVREAAVRLDGRLRLLRSGRRWRLRPGEEALDRAKSNAAANI